LLWADLKHYLRKKPSSTKEELVNRIQKFFRYKLSAEKCTNYINHLKTVIPIIIERHGDWSDR
jgi:hypothetical protein